MIRIARSDSSRWKADHRQRSRASPHIKTYLRATNDQYTQLLWFLVTSANLSKAGLIAEQRHTETTSVV